MAAKVQQPFAAAPDPSTITAAEACRGEETTLLYFPRSFLLKLQDTSRILFNVGPNNVPKSLTSHKIYSERLKEVGATAYDPSKPVVGGPELNDQHVAALRDEGFEVQSLEDASQLVKFFGPEMKADFMKEVARRNKPKSQAKNQSVKPPVIAPRFVPVVVNVPGA